MKFPHCARLFHCFFVEFSHCAISIFSGAISVSGMKTITIRNLALAQRSVQLVIRLIPYVKKHFEGCLRKTEGTQAESKQIETFRKQFDQVSHLKSPKIHVILPKVT